MRNASHDLRTPIAALRLTLDDLALWPETAPTVAEQLRRATGELERLAEAVDDLLARLPRIAEEADVQHSVAEFAGIVSHDLRQPLTALLANAEMLATEPAVVADPEVASLANASFAAGGRLAQMIDVVDSFARAAEGPRPTEVALDALLQELSAELAPQLAQRQATLEFDSLPVVQADRPLLHAALYSLITRSLKLPGSGDPRRVLVTASSEDDGCKIRVTDNAQPTPPSGLGWAAARRVAAAHGGRIGVDEVDGNAVWLLLP